MAVNQRPQPQHPAAPGSWSSGAPMFNSAPSRPAPSLYRDQRVNSVVSKPAKYA